MGACVIGPDVLALHTSKEPPLSFILWKGESQAKQFSDQSVVDAFTVADIKIVQIEWFGTGEELESVLPARLRKKRG